MTEPDPSSLSVPADAWRSVLVVMERLAASSDLEEVLGLVIDAARDTLHAERASVFQYDKAKHELFATQAHGVGAALRFSADSGLAGEAVRTGSIINVTDCYADARFNRQVDQLTGFRTRCLLTIPLVSFDGGLEGVAQVLNKDAGHGGVFDAADEIVARALASQAAVAIRRATLIQAERRKNKIEADLGLARIIQQSALPQALPAVSGYDIAAQTRPAEETGGDAFDVMALDDGTPAGSGRQGTGGLMLMMADATGHGIGPALSVAQVQAMARMGARLGVGLDAIVRQLNAHLCVTLPSGRFVTAFIGVLDPVKHEIRSISAGQAPILLVRRGADGGVEERTADVMPLGVDPQMRPEAAPPLRLNIGDVFVLLSDGYYERQNAASQVLGGQRVVEAVRKAIAAGESSARSVLRAINHAAEEFAAGRPADDDQTAIIVTRTK